MRIAIINLLMRTVKSNGFIPQLDPSLPRGGVIADSPMAVLLADELAIAGHDVDIYAGSMFQVVRDSERPGKRASIIYSKEAMKWLFPPSFYPLAPSIIPRVRKGGYDVILTSELIQPSTLAALAVRSGSTKVFVWQELASHPRFPASLYSKSIFAAFRMSEFKNVHKIVPRSVRARQFLLSEGVPEARISRIIPNAVDCRTFTPEQPFDYFEKNGLGNPPRPRVLMVARIDKSKGIQTFLRAADIAVRKGYQGSFVLKVTGNGVSEVRKSAERLALVKKVIIIGEYLRRRDLANLMASCDVCAAPSSGDLLFLVPLEAMASGLPVITTPQTHHSGTFSDGKAGFLVPPDNPEALAESIVYLGNDSKILGQMAVAARDLATREFSMEIVAQRFITEFRADGPQL